MFNKVFKVLTWSSRMDIPEREAEEEERELTPTRYRAIPDGEQTPLSVEEKKTDSKINLSFGAGLKKEDSPSKEVKYENVNFCENKLEQIVQNDERTKIPCMDKEEENVIDDTRHEETIKDDKTSIKSDKGFEKDDKTSVRGVKGFVNADKKTSKGNGTVIDEKDVFSREVAVNADLREVSTETESKQSESESSYASTEDRVKEGTVEVVSDDSISSLELSALYTTYARAVESGTITKSELEAMKTLAPVYSSVIKKPEPPDPDWSSSSDKSVSKEALTSLAYWDARLTRLRRERRKSKGSSWRAFRSWWEKELRTAKIVQEPVKRSTPASIRGSRIISMIVDETQQDIILEQLSGQAGFDELRKHIKTGEDFCKELAAILNERSEAEAQYAKTLGKLSAKLVKATKEGTGTVNTAWQRVGVEMEAQSELHRNFANALSEEVVKPLKTLVDSQHRIRKSVEIAVDKSGKSLAEWRGAEAKAKKNSLLCAREYEKLRDNPDRRTSTPVIVKADKEAKLETKRRKAEECVKKADVEYYTICLRAERARLEWESAVVRGAHCFQVMEEERLKSLKDLGRSYLSGFRPVGPKLTEIHDRASGPIANCDVPSDLETAISLRLGSMPSQEQLLPDFYAEHLYLAMNTERRKQALSKLILLMKQDSERERKGKYGVENLAKALKKTPTFAAEDTQQNLTDKLHHMRSMLAYLEAARYKVVCALAETEGRQRPTHPLAEHIHITRDRQGYQHSTLKVPPWVHKDVVEMTESPEWERGTADGNSAQPDSDFDEFSSQDSEKEYDSIRKATVTDSSATPTSGAKCKALYSYTANLYDELTLNAGDIINIHDKQPDGWWLGELNGVVGIFPATYVEEIK